MRNRKTQATSNSCTVVAIACARQASLILHRHLAVEPQNGISDTHRLRNHTQRGNLVGETAGDS